MTALSTSTPTPVGNVTERPSGISTMAGPPAMKAPISTGMSGGPAGAGEDGAIEGDADGSAESCPDGTADVGGPTGSGRVDFARSSHTADSVASATTTT